jgi:hypothetical protein
MHAYIHTHTHTHNIYIYIYIYTHTHTHNTYQTVRCWLVQWAYGDDMSNVWTRTQMPITTSKFSYKCALPILERGSTVINFYLRTRGHKFLSHKFLSTSLCWTTHMHIRTSKFSYKCALPILEKGSSGYYQNLQVTIKITLLDDTNAHQNECVSSFTNAHYQS